MLHWHANRHARRNAGNAEVLNGQTSGDFQQVVAKGLKTTQQHLQEAMALIRQLEGNPPRRQLAPHVRKANNKRCLTPLIDNSRLEPRIRPGSRRSFFANARYCDLNHRFAVQHLPF